jgi:pheromone shutdown protein TraB
MARRLYELERAGPRRVPVLCVLGMAHLRGVAAYLDAARREGTPPWRKTLPPPCLRST